MAYEELDYFTCTLGQAKQWNMAHPHDFQTIIELLDVQAKMVPDCQAVGFASLSSSTTYDDGVDHDHGTHLRLFTFSDLKRHACSSALTLQSDIDTCSIPEQDAIGLLAYSSPEFLFTWLGLLHLGYSVLLLAPQLEAPAIGHLCTACSVQIIFHDVHNVKTVGCLNQNLKAIEIKPFSHLSSLPGDRIEPSKHAHNSASISHYFHTSGTSSGLPKPIPQSHYAAVGVLPCLDYKTCCATFSTTPLYHGGIADCLRAWTSRSMIWLYPERQSPMTADNIVGCIDFAQTHSRRLVKYFTSVPYILALLSESSQGLLRLQQMEKVGVGGAALAPQIGDTLVSKKIKLVSRFGSAECGFLLSSDRNFDDDPEWQYLRAGSGCEDLSFEPGDDGLAELVVLPTWAYLSKTNRPDGSFATADLFEPHKTTPNSWRYHSRADSQIILSNGKKFDPSPVESSILAQTSLLMDAMIFGTDHPYAGMLLFFRDCHGAQEKIENEIWPIVKKVNQESQRHTQISKHMLIAARGSHSTSPLPKSSKGTIMRNSAECQFSEDIQASYQQATNLENVDGSQSEQELLATLNGIFNDLLERKIDVEVDFYQQDIDSIACMQLRSIIQATLFGNESNSLPLNFIYESGNLKALANYLHRLLHKQLSVTLQHGEDVFKLMEDLVSEFEISAAEIPTSVQSNSNAGEVVVLTGATGMLGSHILDKLFVALPGNIATIYCLVRSTDSDGPDERVHEALRSRGFPGLPLIHNPGSSRPRIECFSMDLQRPRLGLSDKQWKDLSSQATIIVHAAWSVNFSLGVASFRDHLSGTKALIELSILSGAKFFFISSIATVAECPDDLIEEKPCLDPLMASPVGYARAKWIAEKMCANAHHQIKLLKSNSKAQICVIRVGQLCGDVEGRWNMSEAYPLLLSSVCDTGCLPSLEGVCLDWLPVDRAAGIIVQIIDGVNSSHSVTSDFVPVYHVLNPNQSPSWSQFLTWIKNTDIYPGYKPFDFEIVHPRQWIDMLELSTRASKTTPRWIGLLHLWNKVWGEIKKSPYRHAEDQNTKGFAVSKSSSLSEQQRLVQPIAADHAFRMWKWIMMQP